MEEYQRFPEFRKLQWVAKEWGGELWLVNNELYCAKFLFLKPGFQCSLHRHTVKDETFLVREGVVGLEYGTQVVYLGPGDQQRIAPRTWHRFKNAGKQLAIILEVSTHHDDSDVERQTASGKL